MEQVPSSFCLNKKYYQILFGKGERKMEFKKWLNKITKIFVVLGMVLSMCFTAGNTNTVEAWNSGIPHEFTRVKNIKYPEWWGRKIASLKQWSTYSCTYNGQWSYCLESSKKTPSAGNYTASVIENNSMVRKLLYYGGSNGRWNDSSVSNRA